LKKRHNGMVVRAMDITRRRRERIWETVVGALRRVMVGGLEGLIVDVGVVLGKGRRRRKTETLVRVAKVGVRA
jgi:hypothetical protein